VGVAIEMEKEKNQYYTEKRYEVLENKSMIHVFKKSFWFKHLKWWKGFSKEFYLWKEDNGVFIIINKIKKMKNETRNM